MSTKPVKSTHSRKSKGQEFWIRHVKAFQASGLNKADYARRHGLAPNTLYNWLVKLSRESLPAPKPEFIPVQVEHSSEPLVDNVGSIQITLPNGVQVTMPVSTAPERVLSLIDQLARIHA